MTTGGEYINHFNAVRLRVLGTGNLKLKLIALDEVTEIDLADVTMSSAPSNFPTVNTNFVQSKCQLEIKTTEMNESFLIKEVLIYSKPLYTSYPQ